jgi:hypothetical protein
MQFEECYSGIIGGYIFVLFHYIQGLKETEHRNGGQLKI